MDVATAVANNGAFGVIGPPSLTEDEGAYVGASVAFNGACVSVFANGTGQLGEDNNVESAGGEVGHVMLKRFTDSGPPWVTPRLALKCTAPVDSIVAGEAIVIFVVIVVIVVIAIVIVVSPATWQRRTGSGGPSPSVVVVVIGSGGGGAVPDPVAAERGTLDHRAVPPRPLRDALSLSPSSSSRRHPPPTYLCRLPPLLIVKCFPLMLLTIVVPRRPHLRTWMTSLFVVIAAVIFSSPLHPHPLHSIGASTSHHPWCGDDAYALGWGVIKPQAMVGAKAALGHGDMGVPQ